jgi:hypothetical protein
MLQCLEPVSNVRDELPLFRRNRLGIHEIEADERGLIPNEKPIHLCELRGLTVSYSVFRTSFVPLSVRNRIRLSRKIGLFVR